MGPYYAGAGPDDGILMYCHVAGSLEVFEDPDRSIPIGTARCIGWDAAGSAVWRLLVRDDDFEGPWVIVDREFLATGPNWHDLYRVDRPRRAALSARGRRGRRPGGARRTRSGVGPSLS